MEYAISAMICDPLGVIQIMTSEDSIDLIPKGSHVITHLNMDILQWNMPFPQ
jgi:hypothetical protein